MARFWMTILVMLAGAGVAAAAHADEQRPDPATAQHPGATDDFMFAKPHGSVGLRGSWVMARAGSDIFDFVTDQLTIEKRDFNTPAFGAELGIRITSQLEALGGFEFTQAKISSEYRRFIGSNDLPIGQDTTLNAVTFTGSVKFSLLPRGRAVSRLAWIPRGVTPFVGGGGGAVRYDFQQFGSFVDYQDMSVFNEGFISKGWAPSAHAFGGVDLQVYRRMFVSVEGRYQWAAGKLGRDFIDFDPIDLAGFRMSGGVHVLF